MSKMFVTGTFGPALCFNSDTFHFRILSEELQS
jgi:hypothetical protein